MVAPASPPPLPVCRQQDLHYVSLQKVCEDTLALAGIGHLVSFDFSILFYSCMLLLLFMKLMLLIEVLCFDCEICLPIGCP